MGMTIGLGLITGGIFWQCADQSSDDYDLQSHFGAIFQIGIGAMFGAAQPLILTFPTERPVFMREYAVGAYGGNPYFWSKVLVELPLTAITSGTTSPPPPLVIAMMKPTPLTRALPLIYDIILSP
jgi:hypothetical protein